MNVLQAHFGVGSTLVADSVSHVIRAVIRVRKCCLVQVVQKERFLILAQTTVIVRQGNFGTTQVATIAVKVL